MSDPQDRLDAANEVFLQKRDQYDAADDALYVAREVFDKSARALIQARQELKALIEQQKEQNDE